MSQRVPGPHRPSRREVFRALAVGLPAVAAACADPVEARSRPLGTVPATGLDTGEPSPPLTPRAPEPAAPWGGVGAPDPAAFPLGMQTGDPASDGLVVWAYTALPAASIRVHWARWDGATWVPEAPFDVAASPEGYMHADLEDLAADTAYAFQAEVDGVFAPLAHGRTAIADDAYAEVRIGACSCLDQNHGEFPCLDEVAGRGPMDAFVWLGDTVYADARFTEDGYRSLWQEQLSKGSFQRLLAAVPGVFTWDDHEVANNWSPQDIDPQRFAIAQKTFFETLPFPSAVRDDGVIWRSLRFGRTVEMFVLDCRSERDYAKGLYISIEQMEWLKAGLAASDAVWKVVATSVPITDWPALWDALGVQVDRWDGYPGDQRRELLDAIAAAGVTGVLFLAGDLHQTTLSYLDPEGGTGARWLEVLAGPGGSFRNTPARLQPEEGQFLYMDAEWSALRMTFHPNGTARFETVNEDGVLLFDATATTAGDVTFAVAAHPYRDE